MQMNLQLHQQQLQLELLQTADAAAADHGQSASESLRTWLTCISWSMTIQDKADANIKADQGWFFRRQLEDDSII